ncbi:MAG: hypothetical protein FRX48_02926 [Lasallia pustulata]|uniref:Uncharacterized protein n=1 Tax=Lasallia pustulata TaxID=136370 RepID=A0A5M8PUE7_9LECA|nr:MAG: hypothetical protein FRX48_02926 [Lasallia pustulata]
MDNRALLNELRQEIRQTCATITQEITTLRVDLTTRLDASESNSIARIQNSKIPCPLRDRQNRFLDEFPHNGEALSALSRAQLIGILRAYDLPTQGSNDEKRKRLMWYGESYRKTEMLFQTAIATPC